MKKQKFSLNLSLALIIIASLISATAIKANAGDTVVEGSSVDSSSFAADSFSPGNQTTTTEPAPGNSSIEINNGEITVSLTVQANVNAAASIVIAVGGGGNSGISSTGSAVSIMTRGSGAGTAVSQIQISLGEAGVTSESIQNLTNSILGMVSFPSAAVSGIPIAEKLQPAQLIASNKSLVSSYLVAQNSQPNVDINKLNASINAFNEIVMESDVKTLKKLAKNPEFMAIRQILNQLRAALNS